MIRPAELIERKRDGGQLSAEEWNELMLGYARDEVPELEEAAAGLTQRGERVDGPAGSWRLVEDPWGNPIELFQPK